MRLMYLLFEKFPFVEVFAKHFGKRIFPKFRIIRPSNINQESNKEFDKEEFFNSLGQLEINKGDILLLHSSMDKLGARGVSAPEVINYLLDRLGAEGTLVIPTFVKYDKNIRINKYNKKRSACWTGILPMIFLRYEGVVRSEFPCSTLAAKGCKAEEMMMNNLLDTKVYGPNSPWMYLVNNHAKVLYIDTPLFHTTTISHIVEDKMDEQWPIKDFYDRQKFLLNIKNKEIEFDVDIRSPYWAKNLKSHYRTALLRKHNLVLETRISGINIAIMPDVKDVVSFMTKQVVLKNKTMYYVPRKYKK